MSRCNRLFKASRTRQTGPRRSEKTERTVLPWILQASIRRPDSGEMDEPAWFQAPIVELVVEASTHAFSIGFPPGAADEGG